MRENGSGVEPCVHLHDRYAGLAVARKESALDRRGTAPAWQQRRVDVDRTLAADREHCRRQQQSVGDNDDRIAARGLQLGDDGVVAQALRLQHLQVALQRQGLDRARTRAQAAAGRTVGLREHQDDAVAGVQQPDEGALRERGSSRED